MLDYSAEASEYSPQVSNYSNGFLTTRRKFPTTLTTVTDYSATSPSIQPWSSSWCSGAPNLGMLKSCPDSTNMEFLEEKFTWRLITFQQHYMPHVLLSYSILFGSGCWSWAARRGLDKYTIVDYLQEDVHIITDNPTRRSVYSSTRGLLIIEYETYTVYYGTWWWVHRHKKGIQ
jgi:hypothetical protein